MNIFSIILTVLSTVYVFIGFKIIRLNNRALLNRLFFALNVSLIIWSFGAALYISANDVATFIFWYKISSVGCFLFVSMGCHFLLVFAKKESLLKQWWIYIILYLPSIIFSCKEITSEFLIKTYSHESNGWIISSPIDSMWFWSSITFTIVYFSFGIGANYRMKKRASTQRERKQTSLLISTAILSLLIGLAFMGSATMMGFDIPDVSPIAVAILMFGIYYSIVKYNLMAMTPSIIAENLFQIIIDSIILTNPKGLIENVNPTAQRLLGLSHGELVGKPLEMFFLLDSQSESTNILELLNTCPVRGMEAFVMSKNGVKIPIILSISESRDNYNTRLGFVLAAKDISEYKRAAELVIANKELQYQNEEKEKRAAELVIANKELEESEQRLSLFFNQSLTGFFIIEIEEPIYWNDEVNKEEVLDYIFRHQKCTRVNKAILNQYGMTEEEFLDKIPGKMYVRDIEHRKDSWRKLLDIGFYHMITDERKLDGTQMFIEGDYTCMHDSLGRVIGYFGNQQDVTEKLQYQNEIEYSNNHDQLTDLYNRRYFFEQFKHLDDKKYYPLGIMMLDVNGLKIVNDAFGHAIGDIALKTLGNILKETFEPKDIVSRIGGDEFAVLLPNTTNEKLQKYKDCLKDAVKKQKIKNIELSLAIGYELKKSKGEDIDDILKLAESYMYRHKVTESSSVRTRAISAILQTLTDKYEIERIHSERVSRLCKLVGQQLKLREDDMKELEQAGLFHDIGKISIPDSILNKPGKLTSEEYDVIKTHVEVGYQILRAADEYSDLAIHALHHHERWDGKGYPSGLKGNDIPLFSRIIGVVDAYEAMTADRPYRSKLTQEYAISEIIKYSGSQFDPEIAKIFVEKVLKANWQ
ncbi:MAG: HD domain-containing phosphohydrolase [Bacillota bacterium]